MVESTANQSCTRSGTDRCSPEVAPVRGVSFLCFIAVEPLHSIGAQDHNLCQRLRGQGPLMARGGPNLDFRSCCVSGLSFGPLHSIMTHCKPSVPGELESVS